MTKQRPITAIGRKRRALGWTLLTLGMLVAVVWVWSGWGGLWFGFGTFDVRIGSGEARIAWDMPVMKTLSWETGSATTLATPKWLTWYGWGEEVTPRASRLVYGMVCIRYMSGSAWGALVLLWPFPLILVAIGAPLLRSGIIARRRVMTNACAKCGYSLAGLGIAPKCPECGKTMEGTGC